MPEEIKIKIKEQKWLKLKKLEEILNENIHIKL